MLKMRIKHVKLILLTNHHHCKSKKQHEYHMHLGVTKEMEIENRWKKVRRFDLQRPTRNCLAFPATVDRPSSAEMLRQFYYFHALPRSFLTQLLICLSLNTSHFIKEKKRLKSWTMKQTVMLFKALNSKPNSFHLKARSRGNDWLHLRDPSGLPLSKEDSLIFHCLLVTTKTIACNNC